LSYNEGKNIAVEYRSAEGHRERLPQLAMELVPGRPDVHSGIRDTHGAGGEGGHHDHPYRIYRRQTYRRAAEYECFIEKKGGFKWND
jgi:hypothetical protein